MGKSQIKRKAMKRPKRLDSDDISQRSRVKRRANNKHAQSPSPSQSSAMKRPKRLDSDDISQRSRVKRRANNKHAQSPSPSQSSGKNSSEELSGIVTSEEEVVCKEPSMYDGLLMALGSGSGSFADLYKRRQREQEGRSDTEEDEDGDSESPSASVEEAGDEEGSDDESKFHQMENEQSEHSPIDLVEEAEMEEDDEASDEDHANDLEVNGQDADASKSTSSFNDHLGRTLSEAEVDDLIKSKWKFKWEAPAVNMSMSKWVGTGQCCLKETDNDSAYDLKLRLYKHWQDVYKTSGGKDFHSSKQRQFFSLCNTYRDIMHCNKKPFYLKGLEDDSSIMDAYIMHVLNHVFRTRDLVTKNDAKVAKHGDSIKEEIINADKFLDHGFTRPKVLILLPLRSIALRVIKRLIQLTPSSHRVNVEHIDRFSKEFGMVKDDDDNDKLANNVHDHEDKKSQKSSKPADFEALFSGNDDDHFMIGIKFTKRSIKLYSDFYSSDVIVASPLGLVTKIGEAEVEKEKDVDYLSSIEVLIIDHADVIAMQNWSHVNSVVEQLNHLPSKQHGTDFMRIRQWYLNGHARFYRQSIVLGSFLNPDINALFNHLCVNYQGKVKLISEYKGVLPKVLLQVRQVYQCFEATSIVDADDARLDYFAKKVFPKIKDSIQVFLLSKKGFVGVPLYLVGGTMLFISSYFEFVRLRNFLKSQNASFCLLGEYTKPQDISRARVRFFEGSRKIMLYTERAHFYRRYKIRGIKNLIIYSLPERKEFYPEILNMLEGPENMDCTVLFSHFDQLRLERIVGTPAAKRMLSSTKDIFIFC